jgi:hypothetical protein
MNAIKSKGEPTINWVLIFLQKNIYYFEGQ